MIFDYIERGAEDEHTLQRNLDVFRQYSLVPRVLRDVSDVDLSTTLQGLKASMPLVIAPTGLTGLFHHQGERAVARAAHKHHLPYCLSTVSTTAIEDIPGPPESTNFFQIYIWHNKDIVNDLIARCKASHYKALCLAVDTATLGNRERDLQNGQKIPLLLKLNIIKGAIHPARWRWLANFIRVNPLRFANLVDHVEQGARLDKVVTDINEQFSAAITWEDAARLQEQWQGPFIIKGIQSVADAVLAAEMGATGIVLSNHGGRQLDGAVTALELLPEVVAEIGGKTEIYIDGGIRRGTDILKAIALGANACWIGRAYLYGLAAGGQQGVEKCIEILKEEMIRDMKLMGCKSLAELTPDHIRHTG
ncbi:MAG: alpha-hydroxy acid oxidase, partial [Ketobacteraceae bacterium]|nr:alpha-hydroxy acid oxidase [Ketobacteraceae bacterium]